MNAEPESTILIPAKLDDGVFSFNIINASPIEVDEPVVDWINANEPVPFTTILLNVLVEPMVWSPSSVTYLLS